MIFGNSGLKSKPPKTTGESYTEKELAGKVRMSEALKVKVPKGQGKSSKKTMGY